MPHRQYWRRLQLLFLAAAFISGCAQLKQCAYEGFNREGWQKPARVIESLELKPGSVVADLGAGGGYFTFRLAEAVGNSGKVYAVDIDRDMIRLIGERARQEGVANVQVLLAQPNDPMLPAEGVDLIFTVNTYHHLNNRPAYFAGLRRYLRPEGRIVIIDFDRRAWLENLFGHSVSGEQIQREMEQAGYRRVQNFDFLDRQTFQIFMAAG